MSSAAGSIPELTVVLVAASGAASIARTIQHLRAQSARHLIELIVVVAHAQDVHNMCLGEGEFHAVQVVPVGAIQERGEAAARGIRRATAPVVGLIEDHSFPEPEWAMALIRAHAGHWAGVGPAVGNANPYSALSWANFVLTYGAFSPPQQAGARPVVPWHNSAYKRALLTPFEDRLGQLLSWEGTLQLELCSQGHELYLEPAARTHHANVSAFISTFRLHLQRGRLIGAARADREQWPRWRRWLFACAFPLYPVMQFRYALPGLMRQQMMPGMRVRTLLMLALALVALAVGEARGIVSGAGNALHLLEDFELHRLKHVSKRERREILAFAEAAK